jgi:hypothetical protein
MRRKAGVEDVGLAKPEGFEGVPEMVAQAFFRGLDDVACGRTVPVQSALAEARRRVADFRERFRKPEVDDPDCGHRK